MLHRALAGTFRSRVLHTSVAFLVGGAIILASNSFVANSGSARPHQSSPIPGTAIVIPEQHRAPAPRIVHPDPQPISPVATAPVASAPIVASPAAPVSRMEPLRIDETQRQEIIARRAGDMKREHCLRKLEARQRELRERSANH